MLTAEQIEMLRQGLLSSDWCGYSKRRTVNELCDMALSALRSHSAQAAASGEIPEARMGVHFDGEWNVTRVTIYDGGAGFKRYIPMVPEKQEEK